MGRNISAPCITQGNISSPPYHPRKTIAGKCITQENRPPAQGRSIFGTSYNPRKHVFATVSTQENNCWQVYHPRKQTASTGRNISAPPITQENISSPPYHPRKQLLASVSPKKTDRQHGTKHFRTYNPRKHITQENISSVATVSPITQENINCCWQVYHPRKQTASTGRNISAPCITQENMSLPPYHPRKQLLASVSPKKTDRQHGTKHFGTLYNPRKHVLATVSPKKTIAGKCITQENRPPARTKHFRHLL